MGRGSKFQPSRMTCGIGIYFPSHRPAHTEPALIYCINISTIEIYMWLDNLWATALSSWASTILNSVSCDHPVIRYVLVFHLPLSMHILLFLLRRSHRQPSPGIRIHIPVRQTKREPYKLVPLCLCAIIVSLWQWAITNRKALPLLLSFCWTRNVTLRVVVVVVVYSIPKNGRMDDSDKINKIEFLRRRRRNKIWKGNGWEELIF